MSSKSRQHVRPVTPDPVVEVAQAFDPALAIHEDADVMSSTLIVPDVTLEVTPLVEPVEVSEVVEVVEVVEAVVEAPIEKPVEAAPTEEAPKGPTLSRKTLDEMARGRANLKR